MTLVADIFCATCGATARRPGGYLPHGTHCGARILRPSTVHMHEVGARAAIARTNEDVARSHGPDATAFLLDLRSYGGLRDEGPRS